MASLVSGSTTKLELHTNFKLSKSGNVILSKPDGAGGWTTVSSILNYPTIRPGLTYGLAGSSATGTLGYFETPTPAALNATTAVTAFVQEPTFSAMRGFYTADIPLTFSTTTSGATLVYTLDGSEPTLTNGTKVTVAGAPVASLTINKTTILRVRGYLSGLGATTIQTQTYIFPAKVLTQDATYVTKTFAGWGHDKGDADTSMSGPADADWAMDPRVTGHANVEDRCVLTDLEAIPTISVVLNWDDLFGTNGIYIAGEGVDKPASLEVINPAGSTSAPNAKPGPQGSGTVHIFGRYQHDPVEDGQAVDEFQIQPGFDDRRARGRRRG